MKFETLEKTCKECAEEFIEELKLLPVFLNYFPDVQEKWLEEIGLSKSDIQKIKKVVSKYAEEKVKLENERLPQKREDVILIENDVLKKMFIGKLIKIKDTNVPKKVANEIIKELYPNCAIINPEQLRELETLTLFKEHEKRFPMNFLVFDPDKFKIIGIEVIEGG